MDRRSVLLLLSFVVVILILIHIPEGNSNPYTMECYTTYKDLSYTVCDSFNY